MMDPDLLLDRPNRIASTAMEHVLFPYWCHKCDVLIPVYIFSMKIRHEDAPKCGFCDTQIPDERFNEISKAAATLRKVLGGRGPATDR